MTEEQNILESALQTLSVEAQVLLDLKDNIGQSFVDCISLIAKSKGRLVVTGIGKSALVAQKIVATMNSTGTSALFMHAADAVHGDMGMIGEEDILLCLSKSGESPEIKVLIPFIQSMGNTIIAMVSNQNSFLATQADHMLFIPISKEADPNNLAPTASTTAQMALGDAMAVALLARRGFTPKDFAKYHPGGALGKQLYLKVSDIYKKNQKPQVKIDDGIRDIILEISSKLLGTAVVIDDNENILGIITDGDLRRMLETEKDVSKLTAGDIMTTDPKVIEVNSLAIEALNKLRENSINQIIAVDDGKYAGIIHLHDLIREGLI